MEDLQKAYRVVVATAQESTAKLGSLTASSLEKAKSSNTSWSSSSSPSTGYADPTLLVARSPRQSVSVWTCSKLCAVFFVAGVFAGYTLKRRVNRWVSKLLRKLRDD
ncbi:hypothetical protein M569_16204 [Genlisea aurea]|uniref:Uncharacterized protein n=1 Tax=Genlisea aurea TaxID=192259 RepID=S8D7E2_9LAMI|nr:hypothetical protein M569_16204 [Genlisea aurea]